jgi:LEA14-like dessication related protein
MTVNTTVVIDNPNPLGATLDKVAFDVYYVDDIEHYLGHGEQANIVIQENGNTTVAIPVKIGNVQALQAVASLIQKGSITLKVNGSAFVDLKALSYELPFERSQVFQSDEFTNLLPEVSVAGTSINITEGLERARGLLDTLSN